MKTKISTFIFFILLSGSAFGQSERNKYLDSKEYVDFSNRLLADFDKTYKGRYKNIDIDSLNNVIFKEGKAKIKIDTLATYKILFKDELSWGTDYPVQKIKLDSTLKGTKIPQKISRKKTAYNGSEEYNGSKLYKGLGIDTKFFDKDIASLPLRVVNNWDELNGVWLPIVFEDYLILRKEKLYIGQSRNTYNKIILYLKKQKSNK